MCHSREVFDSLKQERQQVVLASGETVYAEGKGTIMLKSATMSIRLINVLYVPCLHSNFLSISKFIDAGHTVHFAKNSANVRSNKSEEMFYAVKHNGIFVAKVNIKRSSNERVHGAAAENEFRKWHSRFGHLNCKDLNSLSNKNMVRGLDIKIPKDFQCMTCAVGKITAKPFQSYSQVNTKAVLELVHTDLCGPFKVKSQGGASYIMSFVDDNSRYVFSYFLKQKSEAFSVFEQFVAMAEKQTGQQLKCLRSDNGKEYCNSKFKDYFHKHGVVHQTTVSHTPQQNGVAERLNRTLIEMVRCMLQESGLPQFLWAEAANTATYIRNRSPTKVLGEVTPYEKWHNRKPSVGHFRTFGCDAVMLLKNSAGGKLLPKGQKMKLVGYESATKGYRLYNPAKREVVKARDLVFFENSFEKTSDTVESTAEFNLEWPSIADRTAGTEYDVVRAEKEETVHEDSFETATEEEASDDDSGSDGGNAKRDSGIARRGRGRRRLISIGQRG